MSADDENVPLDDQERHGEPYTCILSPMELGVTPPNSMLSPNYFETENREEIKAHWNLVWSKYPNYAGTYLKTCLSLKNEKYFVRIGIIVSEDVRIMKHLDAILNLIHVDCAQSEDMTVLRRSVLVIQALFSNEYCVLNVQQRIKLVKYLFILITKIKNLKTLKTLMSWTPPLLADVIKVDGEVDRDCYITMMNLMERYFLETDLGECRIACWLLDTLILMGKYAIFDIVPKCFDKLWRKAVGSRAYLREEGDTSQDLQSPEKLKQFYKSMEEAKSGNELYWKLCEACEILISEFFKESYTEESILDHVNKVQCFYPKYPVPLPHDSLASFYQQCLNYFGEAITNRLSAKYTEANIYEFRETLKELCSIYVHNNTYLSQTQLLHRLQYDCIAREKERVADVSENDPDDPDPVPENLKNMELRCGLIDTSRANENEGSTSGMCHRNPEPLTNNTTLRPPDYAADKELLDRLSKVYAEGVEKHMNRTERRNFY